MKSRIALGVVIVTSCLLWNPATALASTIAVTPTSPNGWTFYETDSSGLIGTGTGTGQFVNGPAAPPLGTGSANFITPSGGGDQSVQLRTNDWAGTRLDSLTSLGYSTYAAAFNGSQLPWLRLYVDIDNDGSYDDRWNFEPVYSAAGAGNGNPSPQATPALNTWQTWNALSGMWYSDLFAGPGSSAITFAALLALEPNATIVIDDGQNIGGLRLTSGLASAANNFNTNVDAFTIGTSAGTTTYNFELADATGDPVPEPMSLILLGSGLVGVSLKARRERRKTR